MSLASVQEPNPSVEEICATLLTGDGYVVLPNQLSPDQVRRARSIALSFEPDQWGTTRCLLDKDPVFEECATHPSIMAVGKRLLGATFRMGGFGARIIFPNEDIASRHGQTMAPHRDYPYRDLLDQEQYPMGFGGLFTLSLQVMVALSDYTEGNGATALLPGSQLVTGAPDPDHFQREHVQMIAPAGSIGFWPGRLWHSARPNRTGHPRVGLSIQYLAGFIKPSEDFRRQYMNDRGVAHLSDRTRDLIGLNDIYPYDYPQPRVVSTRAVMDV